MRSESAIKTGKDFVEAVRQRPEPVSIAVGNLSQRWDITFKGASETRKFMEADHARLKQVMILLGVVK